MTGPVNKAKVSAKPKPPPKPKAKPVQPIKREKRAVDEAPRRVSARLRRSTIDPNETPAQKRKREVRSSYPITLLTYVSDRCPSFSTPQQEEEAQRRKEEEERLAAEEHAREVKKPRHGELDLEMLVGQEEWEPGALAGLSSRLQSLLRPRDYCLKESM